MKKGDILRISSIEDIKNIIFVVEQTNIKNYPNEVIYKYNKGEIKLKVTKRGNSKIINTYTAYGADRIEFDEKTICLDRRYHASISQIKDTRFCIEKGNSVYSEYKKEKYYIDGAEEKKQKFEKILSKTSKQTVYEKKTTN